MANLQSGMPFQVRENSPYAEQMPFSGGDLDPRDNQKIVYRQTVRTHQSPVGQILYGVTGVVVCNRKSTQPFSASGFNELLRTTDAVPGKKRVAMKVDLQRHAAIK
jgi:hypothetical protein